MSESQILSEGYLKEERIRASDRCAFALQKDTDIQIDVSLFKHIKVHHYIDEPELHLKSKTSGSHLDISKFVSSNLFQGVCLARGLNAAQFLDNEDTIEELPDFTNEIAIMEGKDLQKQKQMKIMRQRNLMLQLRIREEKNKKKQILKKMGSVNSNNNTGRQMAVIKNNGIDKNTIDKSTQIKKEIKQSNTLNIDKNNNYNNNNDVPNNENSNTNDNIISISGMLNYINEKQNNQLNIDSNMIQITNVPTLNSNKIHKITNLTSNPNLTANRQIQSSMSMQNGNNNNTLATGSGQSISKSSNRTYTDNDDEGSRQKGQKKGKGQELTKRSYSLGNPQEHMMFRRDFERNTSGKIRNNVLCADDNKNMETMNVKTLELQSGDILAEGSFEFKSEKDNQTQSLIEKGTPLVKNHQRSQQQLSEHSMNRISSSKTHCVAVEEVEEDKQQKQKITQQKQEQEQQDDNDKEEITDWKVWDWRSQALAKRFEGVKDQSIWKLNQQQRKKEFYGFNNQKRRDNELLSFTDQLSKKRQHHMKNKIVSNQSNILIDPQETNVENINLPLEQKLMTSNNQLLLPSLPSSSNKNNNNKNNNNNNNKHLKSPLDLEVDALLPTILDKANSRSSSYSSRSNYLSNRSNNNSQIQQHIIRIKTEKDDQNNKNEQEKKQTTIEQSSPSDSEIHRQIIKKNRQVLQKEIVVNNDSEKSESLSVKRTIEQHNEVGKIIQLPEAILLVNQDQQQVFNLYNQPKEMKEWSEEQILDKDSSQLWSRKQSLIKNTEEKCYSKQNNYSNCQSACASSQQRREDITRNVSAAESRNYSVNERDNNKNNSRHRRVLSEASETSRNSNDILYHKKELREAQIHSKNDTSINGIKLITRKDIELKRALKQQVILSPIDQLIGKAKKIQSKYEESVNHVQKIIESSNSTCVENIKNTQHSLLNNIQKSYHSTPLGNLKTTFNLILDKVLKA